MNNCPDQRGQTVQVGAIVTLGFVVLAITIFQAQGVPQETIQTEVEHNQEVADQLEAFNIAIAETTETGTPQTTTLRLGTVYDDHPFFVYPPPTAGSLETTEPRNITIENANATEEKFRNYWNSSETRNYTTSSIRYEIDYRELQDTPSFTFEYGFAVAEFENTTQEQSPLGQPVINGNDISLIVYDGELAERSSTTESIVVENVTNTKTVEINNDSSPGPITLTLPTELDEETWNETVEPDSEPNIKNWSHDTGTVSFELEDDQDYTITVHKVDVGSNATEPEPTYLRELDQNPGENVTVDVRTEFNEQTDETVGAWVYNETNSDDPVDTLRIPPEEFTYKTDHLDDEEPACLTIEEDVDDDASSYETLDIKNETGVGGCP